MKLVRILFGATIGLILLVLVGPFLVPIKPLEGLARPEDLADPDSEFVEIDGLKFHYKRAGDGRPAMILLHGFSSSTFTWRSVIEPLAKLGTVVAYDRPSSGLTERPLPGHPRMEGGPTWTGVNPYSPPAQAAQVVEFMDKLGIDKAILIGNSAGGTVAMNAALTYPERVQGLVLVDAAIYTGGGAPGWIKPLLKTPQLGRLGPLAGRFLASSGERLIGLAWHDPSKVTPEVQEGYRKALQAQDWDKGLWEFTKASAALNLGARVKEVTQPVLVITGDDDRIVPTQDSIRLAVGAARGRAGGDPRVRPHPSGRVPGTLAGRGDEVCGAFLRDCLKSRLLPDVPARDECPGYLTTPLDGARGSRAQSAVCPALCRSPAMNRRAVGTRQAPFNTASERQAEAAAVGGDGGCGVAPRRYAPWPQTDEKR